MAFFTYNLGEGDRSPGSATFSTASQSTSEPYYLENPTFNQLRAAIIDVLGYTDTRVTDGRITRYLPLRHNVWQWQFANSLSVQAVGIDRAVVLTPQGAYSPLVANSAPLYKTYEFRIGFAPRNYNSWQNGDIQVLEGVYYDKDDDGESDGIDYAYATEWHRFTELIQTPANQHIHAQHGQMLFRANGSGGAVDPDGFPFQDAPKMYLPDSVVKIRWYEVPYRYVTSEFSYLSRFTGRINQYEFGYPKEGGGFEPYGPGSLLYLGANVLRIYTPPVPDEGLLAFNVGDGFTRGKLCDLELNFLFTARKLGTETANTPEVANRNWIVGGWNLLPWLTTRKFYYATSYDPDDPADETKWYPHYFSFPFELLFTDPDADTSPLIDP